MSFKRLILYRAILFLVLLSFSANSAVASDIAWPVNIEKRLVREDTNQGGDLTNDIKTEISDIIEVKY
jgi:hypothetical protein